MSHDKVIAETVHEQIRQRAYEIYVERNRQDGFALNDWLRAEHEVGKNAL